MAKTRKHYLEKKIEGIDQKYSKIPDQYSELKNIYRGKDAKGKKANKLHKLKDRYGAAETYLQNLEKQNLTPEQRKYLVDLARTFVEYDLKLDKKRKADSEYKTSLRAKRIEHLGRTLEYIAQDEPIEQTPSTSYKTLDNYVQTPKIIVPPSKGCTHPQIVTTPSATSTPSLISRMYQSSKNATSNAYNATKRFTKKYWKYGATFVAGAAVGSLITYYCMTKPVVKPVPQPIKQEQVIKKQGPKAPIVKKQTPPVIKKEQPKYQPPVVKEEQKPTVPKIGKGTPAVPMEALLTEKDWTNKFKKGEIDLNKYDVFFSGMWHDPGAIVCYKKGNDKIRFDTALSGDLMWDDIETKKELDDLVNMMEKNNMFGSGRIALRAEYIKNKAGEILGIIFTDSLNKRIANQKDGKVMVYSIINQTFNGGGDGGSGPGSGSGSGGSGGGGPM